jgi:hypothetical protein
VSEPERATDPVFALFARYKGQLTTTRDVAPDATVTNPAETATVARAIRNRSKASGHVPACSASYACAVRQPDQAAAEPRRQSTYNRSRAPKVASQW